MTVVRTINGDIDPKRLGVTDAHDHLIRIGGMEAILLGKDFLLNDVQKAIEEASSFVAAGGESLVDMGAIGLGRDIRKLLKVTENVKLNIIAATGFHKGEFYDNATHWVNTYSVETIAELLIADIEEGIDIYDYMGPVVERSLAKAGVIKIATGYGTITPFEDKFIHAAALAQKETGAAISTHTQHGTMAVEQVQRLTKYGASPERIILGHVQRNPDPWYHKRICSMGASLMYDGGYRIKYLPDSSRVNLIKMLIDAGYEKHILLGVDAGKASYQKAYGGGVGIDYDLTVFKPRMIEDGIPENAIEDIFVNNPARLFALQK